MKKTLTVILALSVVCIIAIGGTMSYLTYTDYDVNTMTVGQVAIQQFEMYRDDNSNLQPWHSDDGNNHYQPGLFPNTHLTLGTETIKIQEKSYQLYNTDGNVVDKIIYVQNKSTSQPAYVRTLIAFEMKKDPSGNWSNPISDDVIIYANGDATVGSFENTNIEFEKNNVRYIVYAYTYTQALDSGATSEPSLLQVYLASDVENDFYDAVSGGYDILVLSQAVQTAGFDDAEDAFNAVFPLSEENITAWFNRQTGGANE